MWEQMSIDQYAELQRATGANVVRLDGTWWVQVRRFFYRPLLPFEIHDTQQMKLSFGSFSAFQHAVKNEHPHNSFLNLVIFDQLQSYNLMNLPKDKRKTVRRALKQNLTVSRVTDPEEFIEKAFPVYKSFYNRTKYAYKKDRIKRENFAQWGRLLYRSPGVVVLGAFSEEKMISVDISCLVEDTLILKSSINSDMALKLRAPELLLHFCRENAAKRPDIRTIYAGIYFQKEGINKFKIERGAQVVALPAYLHINPVLLWLFKIMRKNVYERLIGINKKQMCERISSIKS